MENIIEYNGQKVEYIVTRARVKNIYLKIKDGKIEVRAPKRVSLEYIDNCVQSKKKWIYDSLKRQAVHNDRHIDLVNKDYIYILDKKINLEYIYVDTKQIKIELSDSKCNIYVPKNMKVDKEAKLKIQKKLENLEKKYATIIISQIMEECIKLTGLKPQCYSVRKFKSMWGNCSSKREIKINQNVIWYSKEDIKYVCIHELCHLKYMNHQKEFWNLVEKYMPNYKKCVKRMKE